MNPDCRPTAPRRAPGRRRADALGWVLIGSLVGHAAAEPDDPREPTVGVVNAQALVPLFDHLDSGGRLAVTQATDSNGNQLATGDDWRRWGVEPWLEGWGFAGAAAHALRTTGGVANASAYRGTPMAWAQGDGLTSIEALDADFAERFTGETGLANAGWRHRSRGVAAGEAFSFAGTWMRWQFDVTSVGYGFRNAPALDDTATALVTYITVEPDDITRTVRPEIVVNATGNAYRRVALGPTVDARSPARTTFDVSLDFAIGDAIRPDVNRLEIYPHERSAADAVMPVFGIYGSIFSASDAGGVVVAPAFNILGGKSWFHHAVALDDRYYVDPTGAQAPRLTAAPGFERSTRLETIALFLRHLRLSVDAADGYALIRWSGSGNGLADDCTRVLPDAPQPARADPDGVEAQVFNLVRCIDRLQSAWEHPLCGGEPDRLVHVVAMSPNAVDGPDQAARRDLDFPQRLKLLHRGYWRLLGDPASPYYRPNVAAAWVSHDLTRREFADNYWRAKGVDDAHFSPGGFRDLGRKEQTDLRTAAWIRGSTPADLRDFFDAARFLQGAHDGRPSADVTPRLDPDGVVDADDVQRVFDAMFPVLPRRPGGAPPGEPGRDTVPSSSRKNPPPDAIGGGG